VEPGPLCVALVDELGDVELPAPSPVELELCVPTDASEPQARRGRARRANEVNQTEGARMLP
jgi:hypothetical protein